MDCCSNAVFHHRETNTSILDWHLSMLIRELIEKTKGWDMNNPALKAKLDVEIKSICDKHHAVEFYLLQGLV